MGKQSDSQVLLRRKDIRGKMLSGMSSHEIKEVIMPTYGVGKSTVENDITVVYKEFREYIEKHKDSIISEHIAKYDKIFMDCMAIGNSRDALKALRQKEELLRYHKQEPLVAIQNNTMNLESVSDTQLMKAIEQLKKNT